MEEQKIWDEDIASCEIMASGEVLVLRRSHATPEHCWENDPDDEYAIFAFAN